MTMRFLPFALIAGGLISGCTTGNIADHIGPTSGIVTEQLGRYGLDARQTQCVSEALAGKLSPLQMRRLERRARSVTQGYYEPGRLTVRDLTYAATTMDDPVIGRELVQATVACDAIPKVVIAAPAAPVMPEERPAAWLNLGSALSGQSIAIDASTLEREAALHQAWFRLTDPGAKTPSDDIFLLKVDCTGKTINATERRKLGPEGKVIDEVQYPDNPLPVEEGTVMQIAYLALCT
jgi:hypothetical protein